MCYNKYMKKPKITKKKPKINKKMKPSSSPPKINNTNTNADKYLAFYDDIKIPSKRYDW